MKGSTPMNERIKKIEISTIAIMPTILFLLRSLLDEYSDSGNTVQRYFETH
jgi:hypothetical protein